MTNSAGTTPATNMFLTNALPLLFIKTAAPIILVMVVNGLFTLVDAYFLGAYVGADALTAVTLMFPAYMILIALSTLVSNGYSSVVARLLGANKNADAGKAVLEASALSFVVCISLIALFLFGGKLMTLKAANGSELLSDLGYTYMAILIFCSPLVFVLAIGIDTLRSQGKMVAMTVVTLSAALLNIFFDYLFIVKFGWGVAGSAYGTVVAQVIALVICGVVFFATPAKIEFPKNLKVTGAFWGEFLALGIPTSLGYVGVSLSAAATLFGLQTWAGANYETTAAAYGIITRLMTFMYLPLLGMSLAFQAIVGNNFGAQRFDRTDGSLKLVVLIVLVYCVSLQAIFWIFRSKVGFVFVESSEIAGEVSRLIPFSTAMLFVFGPLLVISIYFQAIGDATRAAILNLSRTYAFSLPLIFALPFVLGEVGIWFAAPVSEVLMIVLTIVILSIRSKKTGQKFGLFQHKLPT